MAAPDGPSPKDDAILDLLAEGSSICRAAGRGDLAHLLDIAGARLRRPATVVCIVGEYKRGKSRVVNALAGRDVCPVDDDLATRAITVIGHGDQPQAFAHRNDSGERVVDEIELADVAGLVAETAGSEPPSGIDMVEITIPSPALAGGLTLVDTPGVNAFRSGDDRAVLDFLPYADGLVLVTDASAELSPSEIRFLDSARAACPVVLVAMTKIDLYPEWRRIVELDTGHLAKVGLDDALIPISSELRIAARTREDDELAEESGFGPLLTRLERHIVAPARLTGRLRARDELLRAIRTIHAQEAQRVAAMEDRGEAERRLARLSEARRGIAAMREASSKWLVALNDGITDIRNEVDYRLRSSMRGHLQYADGRLTEARPAAVWDDLCADLRTRLGKEADGIFSTVRDGTMRLGDRIAALIAEEASGWAPEDATGLDVDELWSAQDRELRSQGPTILGSGLSVLRGGYSGMLMLGMLSQLAGVAALGTVTLGAGALFGVKQFRDERRRRLELQRQEARTVMRQFLEQVQFELGAQVQRAVKDAHRRLRDHFGDLIQEMASGYAETASRLEEAIGADAERRAAIEEESHRRMSALDALAARTGATLEPTQ